MTREEDRIYRALSRRGFIGATAGATLASLVGREPQQLRAAQTPPKATADAVIVLWMAGGMASTETFDPKRYTPFAPGVPIKDVLSTFPSIDTKVDHIKFTQGLENIASVIDKGAVIRSFMAADLGFILHSRHQYHWHTGYIPPQPMAIAAGDPPRRATSRPPRAGTRRRTDERAPPRGASRTAAAGS